VHPCPSYFSLLDETFKHFLNLVSRFVPEILVGFEVPQLEEIAPHLLLNLAMLLLLGLIIL
jgi:hypothetical protein